MTILSYAEENMYFLELYLVIIFLSYWIFNSLPISFMFFLIVQHYFQWQSLFFSCIYKWQLYFPINSFYYFLPMLLCSLVQSTLFTVCSPIIHSHSSRIYDMNATGDNYIKRIMFESKRQASHFPWTHICVHGGKYVLFIDTKPSWGMKGTNDRMWEG